MKSIRTTLALSLLAGITTVITIAGCVVHGRAHDALVTQFDHGVAAKVRSLGAQLELEGSRVEFHYVPGLLTEFEGGEQPEYFQLANVEGTILDRSATLGDDSLPIHDGPTEAPAHYDLVLPDGRRGRAAGITIVLEAANAPTLRAGALDDRPRVTIVVARGRDEIDRALANMRSAFGAAGAVTIALVAILVMLTTRRGLSPLAALARDVAALDEGSLATRFAVDRMPRELAVMVAKLNELLERLDAALARERRMTGNLAHELRTPVAELRTAIDVTRRWPDDPALRASAIDTAHSVATRMTELVTGLLRLARVTAGHANLELEERSFGGFVDAALESATGKHDATARGLRFARNGEHAVTVRTDPALLAMLVHNVIDNALRFAPHGTTIESRCEVDASGGSLRWTVSNVATELDAEDANRLTAPFWQKDPTRSDGRHVGLGLSLVRTIAAALDAHLEFVIGDKFTVSVHLSHSASSAAESSARLLLYVQGNQAG